MILQALCGYYDTLADDESSGIPPVGYSSAKISYVLSLSKEGILKYITPIEDTAQKGNKIVAVPRIVPEFVETTSGIKASFLCNKSKYVFGIFKKDKAIEFSKEHFEEFKKLHFEILENVEDEGAKAVLNFLNNWDLEKAEEILQSLSRDYLDFLEKGNFIFRYENKDYIHDRPKVKEAWEKYYQQSEENEMGHCLITGEETNIAKLHRKISLPGNTPSPLVSIDKNSPAYDSYGKKEGYNAPVGVKSVVKYTLLLNHLLLNRPSQKNSIGDITIVFWAKFNKPVNNEQDYYDIVNSAFNPTGQDDETEDDIKVFFKALKKGKKISYVRDDIAEDARFYILGLSPNKGRVVIRFFHCDTFGNFVDNLIQHHKDMELEGGLFEYVRTKTIIEGITPKSSKNKNYNNLLASKIMNSIITGEKYPENFLSTVITRIKNEQDKKDEKGKMIYSINHPRVAIIKAYLSRNVRKEIENIRKMEEKRKKEDKEFVLSESDKKRVEELEKFKKEVLNVSLNEKTENVPYRLGRLFYLLEKIQRSALGDINASVKDKFFSTASATPGRVFPSLLRNNHHHLSKIEGNWADIEMRQIMDGIKVSPEESNYGFPALLNLEEQGLFVIGYYHQKQHDINQAIQAKAEKEAKKKETAVAQ